MEDKNLQIVSKQKLQVEIIVGWICIQTYARIQYHLRK